ncbi:MAG TPA: translation initiation factor IF-2 [Candidatus Saccharimonadales bacterium]|nr:translation initiation factor IF-2 [Candidatus Saccharimonadales bacterium]
MSETTDQLKSVELPAVISVGDFSQALGLPVTKVMAELMRNGVMATINEQIDFDTAAIIASDLGFEAKPEAEVANVALPQSDLPKGEGAPRPPVVAVMGHVDHGKTSLLDAIRSADVASAEAGGITQHIGAYQVKRNDRLITFLDTPGHEAFSAIRAHGARITDVAIIVVAADDGVKPQTKEAIRFAKEAGVQIVVAINKIDKPGADVNRVKQELSELELVPEDWGGQTVTVEVSAKSGTNIDKLLDMVLLVVDLEDLRARITGLSDGVVVESHLESGRGPVATLLVSNGQLDIGDVIVSGATYGKIRSLQDYLGHRIKHATPGTPAVVTGLKAVPAFGDPFREVEDERQAKVDTVNVARQSQVKSLMGVKKIGFEEIKSAITAGKVKELNIVIKADVQGSLEALLENLGSLRNEEVGVKVVQSGLGDIAESDVTSAKTASALLIGFNVGISSPVRQLAIRENVKIQQYKVIYELLDDIRNVLSSMLSPEVIETTAAKLEILGVFKTTKTQVVCGGRVTSGKVEPNLEIKIFRAGQEVGRAKLASLQKNKQAAKEVLEGEECGLSLNTTTNIELGDELEFYTTEERSRSL